MVHVDMYPYLIASNHYKKENIIVQKHKRLRCKFYLLSLIEIHFNPLTLFSFN